MPNINFIEFSTDEIPEYIDDVITRFAEAITKIGIEKTKAEVISENQVLEFFPGRKANDKQHVFHIFDYDSNFKVGWLWLANRGQQELRVADLYIDAPYRHMGYGKAAMMIADKFAQKRHFSVISLNVFDENIVAKKLYSGLGYKVTKTAEGHSEMCKIL